MRSVSLFLVTVSLIPLLMSCQTDSVSLEQTKQITAEFEGSSFVPPPRTIRDITAILDSEELSDPDLLQSKIARADTNPPSEASKLDLAKFYRARSLAAAAVGRPAQALEDQRRATDYGKKMNRITRMIMVRRLAWLEFHAGNFKNAIAAMGEAFKVRLQSVRNNSIMTEFLASIGDIEGARRHAKLSQNAMGIGKRGRNWGRHSVSILQYVLFEAEGKWAAAEPFIRKTTKDFTREWRGGHKGVASAHYGSMDSEDILLFETAKWRSHLVTNLLRQGKIVEAEHEARELLQTLLKRWGKYHLQSADALRTLAGVIHAQGRDNEAERLVRAALNVLETIGVPPESQTIASALHDHEPEHHHFGHIAREAGHRAGHEAVPAEPPGEPLDRFDHRLARAEDDRQPT